MSHQSCHGKLVHKPSKKKILASLTKLILPALASLLAFLVKHFVVVVILLLVVELVVDRLQPLLLCERVRVVHLLALARPAP